MNELIDCTLGKGILEHFASTFVWDEKEIEGKIRGP